MNCPDTHVDVRNQLCGLHYYPGKCENVCNRHFKRWLETEPEVQKLHDEYLREKGGAK